MKIFGLLGKSLKHSFSKAYFSQKFTQLGLDGELSYQNFELGSIEQLPDLLRQQPHLAGFNVTIPYKVAILPYLHQLHPSAQKVGAVNTVRQAPQGLTGYNTDLVGFKQSLQNWFRQHPPAADVQGLILGSGGASKAVRVALEELGLDYRLVSRSPQGGQLSYAQVNEDPHWLNTHRLIINTTPLGTFPEVNQAPELPYTTLGPRHYLYDLVYNPSQTLFMIKGAQQGALVKNGSEMLKLQAEAAWQIWQSGQYPT